MSLPLATLLQDTLAHHRAGRAEDAAAGYRAALDVEPALPTALYGLALLELASGRAERAGLLLERACALRPGHAGQCLALARSLLVQSRPTQALAVLEAAEPEGAAMRAELAFLCGNAHSALGRYEPAVSAFEAALGLDPSHGHARANLGNALAELDRPEQAEAQLRAALAADPSLVSAWVSLGHLLTGLGRIDEAVWACERAASLDADLPEARWNQGVACLLGGRWREGWALYEWRRKRFPGRFTQPSGRAWRGGKLAGQRLLVLAEQGFGDAIQFSRFLPMLRDRGASVVLRVSRPLVPLLRQIEGIEVVPDVGALPAHDCWVDQMSLPGLFGIEPDGVPCAAGYLRAPVLSDAPAARRADPSRPPRIGLVWAGNPAHSNDARRSLPPAAARRLAGLAGPGAISLQLGPRAGELAALGVADATALLSDYADTAAVLAGIDLLLGVDTSVMHLAGAMGVPSWLLLPHAPDWRWLLGRTDTPWYDSLRLFRQPAAGDWDGALDAVAEALALLRRADTTQAIRRPARLEALLPA